MMLGWLLDIISAVILDKGIEKSREPDDDKKDDDSDEKDKKDKD